MTTTLADKQYVDEALDALKLCATESQLTNWDERWTGNERYIALADKLVKQLETAFQNRIARVLGGLA